MWAVGVPTRMSTTDRFDERLCYKDLVAGMIGYGMIWYSMLRYDMTWYGMPRRAVAGMSCYWEAKDPLEGLCRLLICPTMPCISMICSTVGIECSQALAALVEEEQH